MSAASVSRFKANLSVWGELYPPKVSKRGRPSKLTMAQELVSGIGARSGSGGVADSTE